MTPKEDKYTCIREKQISKHDSEIVELKVRDDYNEQRINELTKELSKMDEKLDRISEDIHQLNLQSAQDDFNIDNRVKSLESKLETLKWVLTVGLTALSFVITFLAFFITYVH